MDGGPVIVNCPFPHNQLHLPPNAKCEKWSLSYLLFYLTLLVTESWKLITKILDCPFQLLQVGIKIKGKLIFTDKCDNVGSLTCSELLCVFGIDYFCQLLLLFNLFLQLFMSFTVLFSTIYGSYYIISTNFYLSL